VASASNLQRQEIRAFRQTLRAAGTDVSVADYAGTVRAIAGPAQTSRSLDNRGFREAHDIDVTFIKADYDLTPAFGMRLTIYGRVYKVTEIIEDDLSPFHQLGCDKP
jgi:hypothetical protein